MEGSALCLVFCSTLAALVSVIPVEDITIRVTRPGGAGLRHNDHHVKPSIKLEDGNSVMGLRPGGGLRLVVINRRYGETCSVRQE